VPLVFDENGNGRVEGGLLLSRPPGGNISYIGQLTYENLGAIPNMAFAALRSLDYRQASIAMDGDLAGEIVTRVRFDGVSQGVGAQRNIATRALEGLPIRLDVNIRAQFYSLLGNLRSLYDPSAVKDPRTIGLLDAQGNVIARESNGPPPEPIAPDDLIPNEPAIQRRESEEVP
ncbi:MAG TPA: YdbH domain-containing protein, partial [Thiobacillaceae bacterium]